MTEEKFEWLVDRLDTITKLNVELTDRCNLLGNQIATLKEQYDDIVIEIRILKEGGNL